MTFDYNVQLLDFKNGKIREAVTHNEDDSYTIFIEASLSRQEQIQAMHHAVRHITGGDFWKSNCDEIEKLCHCG